MLRAYSPGAKGATCVTDADGAALLAGAVWIDMINPTPVEEALVESVIGVQVPTRDEMIEIEPSSRLYQEPGGLFLTANLIAGVDSGDPISTAVSFVLTPGRLVTVRYAEPKVFELFAAHVARAPGLCSDANSTLINLLDAVVDRLADVLEKVGDDLDNISRSTFRRSNADPRQRMTTAALTVLLTRIGAAQDIVSKSRDSAVSLTRVISFLTYALKKKDGGDTRERLRSLSRDLVSLTDQTNYLGNNVTFLLDAAMGLINIEQNAIIKIFSVAAVIFLPPTLVASIYGMNFHAMPELVWHYGYPMAIGLMIVSAVLPYSFFKSRGWL